MTEDTETQKALENSHLLIEKTKALVANLEKSIQEQEELLAHQRKDLDRLLKELGIKNE